LIYDIKKADERAETGMWGVIREAAIGNHEVIEKKVMKDSIKITVQINTVTKHPPHLNVVKKWLKLEPANTQSKYFTKF
jgi:hypothetical protein